MNVTRASQTSIERSHRCGLAPRLLVACGLAAAFALSTPALARSPDAQADAPTMQLGASPASDAMALPADGLDKALAALPELVTNTLKRSGVPGAAVAVVHNGKIVFAKGFGVRKLGEPEKVDPATVFQIASISKSMTASAIAVEVSRGVVSWNDPVVKYLPRFKLSDPYVTTHATIGDFMAHRSGLPAAAGDELEDMGFDRTQIIARLRQVPLDAFRTSYHYANFGTTIAAQAVAAAAHTPWETLVAQVLFEPLGMHSTSARHADYLARSDRAVLHAFEDGKFQPLYDRDPDAQAPAGGVSSNVLDMAHWLVFLLTGNAPDGKKLASSASLLAAMSPQSFSSRPSSLSDRPGFYGYGFNVGVDAGGRTTFSHSGGFVLGAGTAYKLLPSAHLGIVVLTNGAPVGVPESINANFMDIVQYGKPLRDWYAAYHAITAALLEPEGDLAGKTPPANPQPARPLQTYVGHYENPYFGPADIAIRNHQLVMIVGPAKEQLVMRHWDGQTFAVMPRNENAPAGSRSSVKFSLDGGTVKAFTVDYFDANGLGTWRAASGGKSG